jgi:hypothetical protein
MEKATREEAMMVAFRALKVAKIPPPRIRMTPNLGMNPWAARMIPISLYLLISCQVGRPSADGTAPIQEKTTRRYMITVMDRDSNIALGIVRRGSFTSSLTVAIKSYPSKAIKVNPMAARTPENPRGKRGVKFSRVTSGALNIFFTPKKMNTERIVILAMVMMFSVLPVAWVPMMFTVRKRIPMKTARMATEGSLPKKLRM